MEEIYDIAVIGGGAAGTMACLRGVLNGDRTVFFEGDQKTRKRARGNWVHEVDNIPGFPGVIFPIGQQRKATLAWLEKQPFFLERLQRVDSAVTRIEGSEGRFKVHYTEAGVDRSVLARYVIVATGVMDIQPRINDSIEPILPYANRGDVIYCIRCDGHHTIGHQVAVIGADDDAIEIAAILKERYELPAITVLTNGLPARFSEDTLAVGRRLAIAVHEAPIRTIEGDPKGTGSERGLRGFILDGGLRIPATKAVISLGLLVYNDLLVGLGAALDEAGQAVVNAECESSVPGLFVAGDLVSGRSFQIYTGWDSAVDAADEINYRLRMDKRNRGT